VSDMLNYTLRRLFQGVFVIIAITAILFLIMQLMPGDPIKLISNPRIPQERINELRHLWGLDKPVIIQYFYWFSNVIKGDFGSSIISGQKVSTLNYFRSKSVNIDCAKITLYPDAYWPGLINRIYNLGIFGFNSSL